MFSGKPKIDRPRQGQGASGGSPAASLALRIRTRLHSHSLDSRLLSGERAYESPELAARAAEVTDQRYRSRIAASLRRLVDAASRPRNPRDVSVPVRRRAILESRPRLLDLARELEEADSAEPRGVIVAARLVQDGGSPAYAPTGPLTLEQTLAQARAALHMG